MDDPLLAVLFDLKALNIALINKNLSNCLLHVRCGDVHRIVLGGVRVANPGQHIGDRIGYLHTVNLLCNCSLPAGFLNTGDLPRMGELPETDAAHAVLAEISVGPAANLTPVVSAGRILRLPALLDLH